MTVLEAAKERARQEVIGAVVAEGRRQLGQDGSAALSLRSVARELGMVSSAIYRFVASRDELLTLLIVEAYDSLGERVEQSVEASREHDAIDRWILACTAVREWALERPHEYALVYGSPVPGYSAPESTIGSGTRPSFALLRIVIDDSEHVAERPSSATDGLTPELVSDFDNLRLAIGSDLDDRTMMATIDAWTQLFGVITFELFGQFDGFITDRAAFFEGSMRRAATAIGLTGAHAVR